MEQTNQDYKLEDLVYVNVKCKGCGEEATAPTFQKILDQKDAPIVKMLEQKGYVPVECGECYAKRQPKN